MPSLFAKIKVLLILVENSWKIEIKLAVRYFTWKLELVSDILWVIVALQRPNSFIMNFNKYLSNLSLFEIFS